MAKEDFEKRASDPLGRIFGPYRPIRRLGVGGMAETFEAIRVGRSGFSQRVCLKLVLPFYQDSEDFIELFEREARLAAKLRHSNIVGIIDFGESEGTPYMALEYVDGVDLLVLLTAQPNGRLSHDLVAYIGYHLAAALEHAHNPPQGSEPADRVTAIIHRDISPSNVLLSRHGEVFLGDFGVAKAITQTAKKQSAAKGKVPYMSPEQLRAEELDGRADLFGLGVVLFEALGGQRPYLREHDPATIMAILSGEHPSLHTLAPDAPEGLCELIESLIAPGRDERPESATQLIELLDEFVPPPRVRRQLGSMVASLAPEKREVPGPSNFALGSTDVPSDSKGGPGADRSHSNDEPESRVKARRRTETGRVDAKQRVPWVWAVLAAALLIGGLGYWVVPRQAPREDQAGAADAPMVADQPASPNVAEPDQQAESESAARDTTLAEETLGDSEVPPAAAAPPTPSDPPTLEPATPTRQPAKLSVIVYPWGRVWINGRPRGMGPLNDVALRPGRYKVSAGQEQPIKTEVIRLRPGEKRLLTLDLTKK